MQNIKDNTTETLILSTSLPPDDMARLSEYVTRFSSRNAELEKEVAHWKNNHETEVRRARILKERTDMPIDRVQAYEKWGEDQRRIVELENDAKERQSDHAALVEENHELRQQLAASQLEAKRLRDTMQKIAGHPEETPPFYWWQIYARNALSSPTSTEALDAYVAEKQEIIQALSIGLDEKSEEISELTRQRDLAVSALKTCLPVYKSGLKGYYPDDQKIHEALAAIKESEDK